MKYSLIAREGRQDQAALSWLARICADWKQCGSVSEDMRGVFDPNNARASNSGPVPALKAPAYSEKDGYLLIIKEFGGKDGLMNQITATWLAETGAGGVGVVVDADNDGVVKRVQSFGTNYGTAFPDAASVRVGEVWADNPRLGFWVAPDNENNGEMDDVLLNVAKRRRKVLVDAGEAFISCAEREAPGKWSQKRSKALLGAAYQVEAPGASLADGLERGKCWFDETTLRDPNLRKLVRFIDDLAGFGPSSGQQ